MENCFVKVTINLTNLLKKFCEFPLRILVIEFGLEKLRFVFGSERFSEAVVYILNLQIGLKNRLTQK